MELIDSESSESLDFLNAATIHPEVLQSVLPSLLPTEPDLSMSSLALTRSRLKVVKSDFIGICSSSMRENRIGCTILNNVRSQGELTTTVEFQQTHRGYVERETC